MAHRYSVQRDRRTELTQALDATVKGFTAADHALNHLQAQVGSRQKQDKIQAAADRVTLCEIDIRSTHRSMILRLPPGHPVEEAFSDLHRLYTDAWVALGPAIHLLAQHKWGEEADAAIADS